MISRWIYEAQGEVTEELCWILIEQTVQSQTIDFGGIGPSFINATSTLQNVL